jgi:hypothetical protein
MKRTQAERQFRIFLRAALKGKQSVDAERLLDVVLAQAKEGRDGVE